jgi:hypothetical protein
MDDSVKQELLEHFCNAFEPIDTRTVDEWARENIVLSDAYVPSGQFNPDLSPHIKLPMKWLTDNSVRQINFGAAVQNFKSGINEIFTVYVALQCPGNTLRVHQGDSQANECMASRIIPMLQNNPKTKALLKAGSYNSKSGFVSLPNGMFIKSCGPSTRQLQSKTIKNLVIEELKFFEDPSMLYEAIARTSRVEKTRKVIICSEPDKEGSALHSEYIKGEEHVWGWFCPHCKGHQIYESNGEKDGKYFGLVWTPQNADGTLTDDVRTNDTRLVCKHCFHEVKDTEDNRINLVNGGDYVVCNSGKRSDTKSVSWSAFVNPARSYKSIALEYLDCKRLYAATGIREHVHRFYNKTMGVFIKQGQHIDLPKLMQDVTNGSTEWPEETHRFLTIDVQKDCMYWVVTAWSNKIAEARLIDWGVCVGYDEITNIKKQHGIKPMYVAIDSGDDTKPIYKESVQRGEWFEDKVARKRYWVPWLCLKGDGGKITPKITYKHTTDGQERYYGMESRPDCQWPAGHEKAAYRARLRLWSNYSIKTILSNIRDGKVPFKLRYNHRADETFSKQMFSEEINPKTGRFENYGRANHLWDCMCMAMVLALMSKCFIPEASKVITEELEPAKT